MRHDWRPTRRLPIDAAPPKHLRGLEALVTAGIAVGLLLLDALCAWLDLGTAEHAAGHGSRGIALNVILLNFATVLSLMGLVYSIHWRKTWFGKTSVVIVLGVIAGAVALMLQEP